MSILSRRLSTLHPQMAMKKSSAYSSRRQRLSNCLATFTVGSSSSLISSMSFSPNCSNNSSSSRTASILLLFIFFATKIAVSAEISKIICISHTVKNNGILFFCNPLCSYFRIKWRNLWHFNHCNNALMMHTAT